MAKIEKETNFSTSVPANNFALQSKVCDWLRFPMAAAVVILHSRPEIDIETIHWSVPAWENLYYAITIGLSSVLTHIAVPVFFVISGYYFFAKTNSFKIADYWQKLRKRSRTLLTPYLLWNFLSIFASIFALSASSIIKHKPFSRIGDFLTNTDWLHFFWDKNVNESAGTTWLGGETFMTYPAVVPLWFIRDLMVVMILSPLIFFCLKKFGKTFLSLLALCFVSRVWFDVPGFRIDAVFFFSFGAYFSIHQKTIIEFCRKISVPALMLACLTFVPAVLVDAWNNTPIGQNIMPFFRIAGVICAFNFATWLVKNNYVRVHHWLASSTFFIFAAHGILINACSKMLVEKLIVWDNAFALIAKYFLSPAITIFICIALYQALKKLFPRVCAILCGGR